MDYKEGYHLTMENANNIRHISNKSAEEGKFGLACSLNILAAEEALKALFIVIKHFFPDKEVNNYNKVFKVHPVKHQELKAVVEASTKLYEVNKKRTEYLKTQVEEIEKHLPSDVPKMTRNLLNSLKEDYIWYSGGKVKDLNFDQIYDWLADANDKKNKGLYVDEKNGKWISPSHIGKDSFIQEKKYTEAIIDYIDWVTELFTKSQEVAQKKEKNQVYDWNV